MRTPTLLAFAAITLGCSLGCACGSGALETTNTDRQPPQPVTESETGASLGPTIRPRDGRFAPRVRFADRELILNGAGLCEWGIFGIDLYRAALYVERRPTDAAAALRADQLMLIHLDFVRELTGAQLREAYTASVRANTGDAFETYRASLDALVATMQTVRSGDSYTFVADPSRGLTIRRNNRDVATIEDDRFRKLFVKLYLGDQPPTAALRAALLGAAK